MSSRSPKPGDFTAMEKQKLEREHQQEQAVRAQELSMQERAEQEQVRGDEVVADYFTTASSPLPEFRAGDEDGDLPYRDVRFKIGVEQMAYGREIVREPEFNEHGELTKDAELGGIRYFDFDEGRMYRLPREMADYLDAKGFLAS